MSEPELAYMMTDSNDGFDLPRWQSDIDPLSSSAQAAHAAQASYLYSPGGAQQPQQQLPATSPQRLHASPPSSSSRQPPRISQIMEQGQPMYLGQGLGQGQLSRSASLGASAHRAPRRHHQPDDLEGAFHGDGQGMGAQRQQMQGSQNAFYPPAIGYPAQSSLTAPNSAVNTPLAPPEAYGDMYYGAGNAPPKTAPDPGAASNSARSPRTAQQQLLTDPFASTQQSPYSPAGPYAYPSQPDQRQGYHSHSRTHSSVNVKREPMTPPVASPYSPQNPMQKSSGMYSPAGYSMETTSPAPGMRSALGVHTPIKQSLSSPTTPLSFMNQPGSASYYQQDNAMVVDPPSHKRRSQGLRRVNGASDLQPRLDVHPAGRRMAADGTYLSPLRQLTTNILETYHICNPQFRYEAAHNPRRVLTKPSKPSHNDGYDNEDYDYILYVNDWLGNEEGHKYLILDILGQGTFGQVVKCQNMKTHEIVAVKVVKNKPAYFNQSMMEVTILDLLNKQCDPNDEHHILRLRDSFIHRQHLCLVFELLSSNLYELIKQNQFQGLSTQLVKVFMAQLLDALTVLKDARLIHCDLKPENILLKSLQSPQIKVIDFGSACHERQTVYTYIQSRFYRSPEVLLGMPYTTAIDMWSLGCIAVELFLGLPLFPGTSEYNQLTRIIEMLGMPPLSMLNSGKQTHQFFDSVDTYNPATGQPEKKYTLKSIQQYSREHNTNEQPGKQYFKATNLPDIISGAPMPAAKPNRQNEMEKELNNRAAFIDFCKGLLDLNPVTRWTPQQARGHPFITGEKYKGPYVPGGMPQPSPAPPSSSPDPKRPYGGLVPQPAKGTRAFQDAASYNQHLAQHQAYTAQAQAASANTFRNPYLTPNNTQPSTQPPAYTQDASYAPSAQPQQQQAQQQHATTQTQAQAQTGGQQVQYNVNSSAPFNHRVSAHQTSAQMIPSNSMPQYSGQPPQLQPNVPPNTYYPNQRSRANTINNQMDNIPPALARLQHMKQDVIAGGRNALTPVLNRDDAMREWEQRQQQGKASKFQPYPQLEHLQQQAEMAAASGLTTWGNHNRYQHPHPPSKLMHSYHPQQYPMMEDDQSRRDAVMSNVRAAAAQGTGSNAMFGGGSGVITSPSQAYNGSTNISNTARYGNAFGPQQQTSPPQQPGQGANVFDSLDRRTDIGNMYVPMQPDQYQQPAQGGYTNAAAMTRGAGPSQASMSGSFYGTGVQPAGPPQQGQQQPQRNPFGVPMDTSGSQSKDASRRGSGIDTWQMKTS